MNFFEFYKNKKIRTCIKKLLTINSKYMTIQTKVMNYVY